MPTTRDAILDGALQVMQTKGLARATTKAIAEAAGFSEAALYKQFADKTAIYLAVIAERLPRVAVVGNGGADLVGTGELADNLRRIAAELLAFYRVVLPIAMSVFSDTELQVRHRDLVRGAGTGPDVNVRGVRAYLEAEQAAGRVRAGAPIEGAALALVGACMHQAFLWTFDHAEDVDLDAVAATAASAVLPRAHPVIEEPLAGGNASGAVRVGETVRKPWTPTTGRVVAFMDTIRAAGVDVPRHRGRDGYGRQVLEWVPGESAMEAGLDDAGLARVGGIVRAIHDASPAYDPIDGTWDVLLPAPAPDVICHNDLAPWNLVVGERWVFVDWDGAGPSSRLWDLAYAAQTFTLNEPGREPEAAAARLRAFIDGYGADGVLRTALPDAAADRAAAMLDLLADAARTGSEPWASMHAAGHGAHWAAASAYVAEHRDVWADALR